MREIKFRGRSVHTDNWCYGSFVNNFDEPYICGFDIWEQGRNKEWSEEKVELHTVGQFTGLHDKNGKEIYEGDIVRFNQKFLIENILFVGYEYSHIGGFSLCTKEGYYGMFGDAWLEPFYCEVIGNIHDNPELLKGGEK